MQQQAIETAPPLAVDSIFKALADPTRRDVLERLSRHSASVSELAAPYRMAMPSFLQHLKLLEGAGLVRSSKSGRVRTYEISAEPLKLVEDWLGRQRRLWEQRLDRLDDYLRTMED